MSGRDEEWRLEGELSVGGTRARTRADVQQNYGFLSAYWVIGSQRVKNKHPAGHLINLPKTSKRMIATIPTFQVRTWTHRELHLFASGKEYKRWSRDSDKASCSRGQDADAQEKVKEDMKAKLFE